MDQKVKSLQEVSEEINEKIGVFKKFDINNGYYKTNLRNLRDIELSNSKIRANLSFKGTNQPISFGYFKSKSGYNNKYKNNKEYADHYGEYIAYIILKQLGKKVCKVDIGEMKVKNKYSSEPVNVEGILSYFQLNQQEIFKPMNIIIEDFKKDKQGNIKENTYKNMNNTNIQIIFDSIENFFVNNKQEHKIPDIRKKIIDMCIFDLKFANRDRHDENYGLKINQITNEIEFYHLFDNEQILGMQEKRKDILKYLTNNNEYEKFKNTRLTSCIVTPKNIKSNNPKELLFYLLEKYPTETIHSVRDISRYQICNLEELMELFPKLYTEHKELAKKIFIERELEINDVVNTFIEKQKNETKLESDEILI